MKTSLFTGKSACSRKGESASDRTVPSQAVPARGVVPRTIEMLRVLVAMTGWRVEHLTIPWIAGGLASLILAHTLVARNDRRLTMIYFVATLIFYFGGNSLILGTRLSSWTVRRFGERRAWRAYESLLGLMFLNQGLGVGCMTALAVSEWRIAAPLAVLRVAGALLFGVGVVTKLWATLLVGTDVFYYKDLFLRRPCSPYVSRGPYRLLRNPMYGVGQLQGYGWALLASSLAGLVAAGIGQILIYVFFFFVERPFVRAVYLRQVTPVGAFDRTNLNQRGRVNPHDHWKKARTISRKSQQGIPER
ncbi:MAG: PEMT/PEM2 methyltransferase family protein [Planctomycetota bacterium]